VIRRPPRCRSAYAGAGSIWERPTGSWGLKRAARYVVFSAELGFLLTAFPLPRPGLLGRYSRPAPLGARVLHAGARGWDVAALQFALAWHGFPSGPLDGSLGPRTDSALRRFQAWSGLVADGFAGPATLVKLRAAPPRSPIGLAQPVDAPVGDGFGPRVDRFHAGVDYLAHLGARVAAAASGRVSFAGATGGGWGKTVIVRHCAGVRTLYAHLSRISVRVGQRVVTGNLLGRVGMSGRATGPHLHFEVLVRGAAVNPLTAVRR
jgi:Peptidase family M23/Putative peptidoglycan binding domain